MRILAIAFVLAPVCAFAQRADVVKESDYVAARSALKACLQPSIAQGKKRRMGGEQFYNFIMAACPEQAQGLHKILLAHTKANGPKDHTAERREEVAGNGVRAIRQIYLDKYMGVRKPKNTETSPPR